MQSIVDTYVALSRPEALYELQAHRLKLIGSERSGFDLFREQIEDELTIIRAGLAKLTPQVAVQQAVEEPDSTIGSDATRVSDEPESASSPANVPTSVFIQISPEPAVSVVEPSIDHPKLYDFLPAALATPILAAAVFSKNGPAKDPAGYVIRLYSDLKKRRKT